MIWGHFIRWFEDILFGDLRISYSVFCGNSIRRIMERILIDYSLLVQKKRFNPNCHGWKRIERIPFPWRMKSRTQPFLPRTRESQTSMNQGNGVFLICFPDNTVGKIYLKHTPFVPTIQIDLRPLLSEVFGKVVFFLWLFLFLSIKWLHLHSWNLFWKSPFNVQTKGEKIQ